LIRKGTGNKNELYTERDMDRKERAKETEATLAREEERNESDIDTHT